MKQLIFQSNEPPDSEFTCTPVPYGPVGSLTICGKVTQNSNCSPWCAYVTYYPTRYFDASTKACVVTPVSHLYFFILISCNLLSLFVEILIFTLSIYAIQSYVAKSVLGQKTIAGTGTPGSSGDGGAATSAQLNNPQGIAVDNNGNLYIADYGNNKIRRVDSAGIITTIAGTGTAGSSGDGGAATAAQLNQPYGVAIDALGQLYIVDSGNHKIRLVSSTSIITIYAGTGIQGLSGDGGAATSAKLNTPQGISLDTVTGNLYIADPRNYNIRKVNSAGIISTFASSSLYSPQAVAWDNISGSLYVADNQQIKSVSSTGIITTFAGTGTAGFSGDGSPATSAQLNLPSAVTVDAKGRDPNSDTLRPLSTLYLLIHHKVPICHISYQPTHYHTFQHPPIKSINPLAHPINTPRQNTGNVYIADYGNGLIREVVSSYNYPTSQPSSRPSVPTSQPSVQVTHAPAHLHHHSITHMPSKSLTCPLSQSPTPTLSQSLTCPPIHSFHSQQNQLDNHQNDHRANRQENHPVNLPDIHRNNHQSNRQHNLLGLPENR